MTIHQRTALDGYTPLTAFGYVGRLFLFRHPRADHLKKLLETSFYVTSNQMIEHGKPFGQHRRATVFNGKPRCDEIVSKEASGRNIKRLSNTHEAGGEVLVMGKPYALITL